MTCVRISLALALLGGCVARTADACQYPENLVPNCELTNDLQSWLSHEGTLVHEPSDGSPTSGCAQQTAAPSGYMGLMWVTSASRCVAGVSAESVYGYGLKHMMPGGGGGVPCGVQPFFYQGQNCDGALILDVYTYAEFYPTGGWSTVVGSVLAPAGAASASLQVSCSWGAQFVLRFDTVFFGPGMTPVELLSFDLE